MSRPVPDPPPIEARPSADDPGPSTVIDVFDDAIESREVKYYQKMMPIDQAYKEAVRQVEKGAGHWGRTNVTLLNKTTFDFKLTCSTCNKEHSMNNPPNFWRSHSNTCKHEGPPGQILILGTGELKYITHCYKIVLICL